MLSLLKKASCSEMHPGLCFSRDRDIYDQCIRCARNVERFLGKTEENVGCYFKITAPGQVIYFKLMGVRARRHRAPQTHVLAACTCDVDGKLVLEVGPDGLLNFMSVWAVARLRVLSALRPFLLLLVRTQRSQIRPFCFSCNRVDWRGVYVCTLPGRFCVRIPQKFAGFGPGL